MKKTLLIAALVAGYAGAAQAESSVTLYGTLDAGIGYTKVTGGNGDRDNFGLINGVQSDSQWGLQGTEDLGSGLQAVFQLESGFDLRTGNSSEDNRLFDLQSTIGLQSDSWGRLDLGRQTNIANKYFGDVASPFGTDFSLASAANAFSAADMRYDNMVMYQTPDFSGFQFGIGYSFNADGRQKSKQSGGSEPNTRALTTGLRYENGPLAAALTYDQFKTSEEGLGEHGVSVGSGNIGLSYDFDVVKVYGGFGQTRDGWFAGPEIADSEERFMVADSGLRVNSYTLGLSAPVGASGQVMASWSMADPIKDNDRDLDTQHIYSLGYTYALSKRTNLYAVGSYARHVLFQSEGGMKATMAGVGVRHQF